MISSGADPPFEQVEIRREDVRRFVRAAFGLADEWAFQMNSDWFRPIKGFRHHRPKLFDRIREDIRRR
jgi:hypothetical protein